MLGNFDCLACQWPASMHHPTQPPTKYPGGIRPKIKNGKWMKYLFFALKRSYRWAIGWDRDWKNGQFYIGKRISSSVVKFWVDLILLPNLQRMKFKFSSLHCWCVKGRIGQSWWLEINSSRTSKSISPTEAILPKLPEIGFMLHFNIQWKYDFSGM